ncbi:nitrate reductase molybdenum cofactor assembly chaperone [Nocardioides sp. J2M5]|uniref:nitrate reductase molybdenum cofactor assembly chaperone n=1 Tax=Nocardioides palaemonis TaxID=2829810 RepID=UPI001BA96AB2|nr:nitrate reductase molybdenum cofactor assembly chaperone [Nocardioides palaemonis]MBS2938384.1 nitrate reductase molybdenum cofactor assembly chaperone [Nocardioides palaemonis]
MRLRPARSRGDERHVWAACSVLLDYPTAELLAALDAVERIVPGHEALAPLLTHLRSHRLQDLQADYVETFDHTRKCALHLTYFAYGDTRRRGLALVELKQAYRDAGVIWDEASGELPDHLCAVLQLGATVDAATTRRLLREHRAGLEMLRLALAGWRNHDGTTGSPWHGAVRAVCDTLPALAGDEADAVRRLVEQGPPAEEVGLGGYGDPASGPALISGSTIPVGAPR